MFYRHNRAPLPQDGIYLTILLLLLGSVVLGVALMLLGGELWDDPGVSWAGFWIAGVSAPLYLFFRWLGLREARRRVEAERRGR